MGARTLQVMSLTSHFCPGQITFTTSSLRCISALTEAQREERQGGLCERRGLSKGVGGASVRGEQLSQNPESLRGVRAEKAAGRLEENLSSAVAQGHLLDAFADGPWLLSPDLQGWQPHGPESGWDPAPRVLPQRLEGPRSRCTAPRAAAQSGKQPRPRPPWSFLSGQIPGSWQRPLAHAARAKGAENAGARGIVK